MDSFKGRLFLLNAIFLSCWCCLPALTEKEHNPSNRAETTGRTIESKSGGGEQDSAVAGLVLKVSGDWMLQAGSKSRPVRQGDAIPDGWMLTPLSQDGSITAVLVDGTNLQCPGGAACGAPITVDRSPSALESWWASAIRLFVKNPQTWVVSASRGDGISELILDDSVVKAQAGQIDLTPVTAQAPAGQYKMRLYRVDGATTEGEPCLGPQMLSIKSGERVVIHSAGLGPGLYRLNLTAADNDSAAQDAWILLCKPERYESVQLAIQDAEKSCDKVEGAAARNRLKGLLHAYMSSLALKNK